MEISDIPLELTDKIFQIKFNPDQSIEKITSYFPLSEQERLMINSCLLYTSPSPRDVEESRMPSSA